MKDHTRPILGHLDSDILEGGSILCGAAALTIAKTMKGNSIRLLLLTIGYSLEVTRSESTNAENQRELHSDEYHDRSRPKEVGKPE